MGEFGAGVAALLDTYGKCLNLLKAFKGHSRSPSDDGSELSIAHSRLRKSIRSDRSRVRAAYAARLYREGSRLSRGDSRSRSKLKDILDKLKGAIRNILDMTKTQQPEIDYASLVTLSNSSRAEAIKTMDDLSRRLNKSSSTSLPAKRKPAPSSTSSSSSKSKHKVAPGRKDAHKTKQNEPSKDMKTKESSHRHQKTAKSKKAMRKPSPKSTTSSSSSPSYPSASKQKRPRGPPKQRPETDDRVGDLSLDPAGAGASTAPHKLRKPAPNAGTPNRISYISMSSDSTKLGEIPLRRSRLVWNPDADDFEYGFRPVYPLHAPQLVTERPGFFRRMFGAREKG